ILISSLSFVEHGKNPDIFTQAFVERTATENQFTNGKIKAVGEFRQLLSDEFTKSFPDLYDNANSMLESQESTSTVQPTTLPE
ncbi:transcription factor subunit Med10 of mediator complex-domain-containing protein, partial [Mucor lusitanicus]